MISPSAASLKKQTAVSSRTLVTFCQIIEHHIKKISTLAGREWLYSRPGRFMPEPVCVTDIQVECHDIEPLVMPMIRALVCVYVRLEITRGGLYVLYLIL